MNFSNAYVTYKADKTAVIQVPLPYQCTFIAASLAKQLSPQLVRLSHATDQHHQPSGAQDWLHGVLVYPSRRGSKAGDAARITQRPAGQLLPCKQEASCCSSSSNSAAGAA